MSELKQNAGTAVLEAPVDAPVDAPVPVRLEATGRDLMVATGFGVLGALAALGAGDLGGAYTRDLAFLPSTGVSAHLGSVLGLGLAGAVLGFLGYLDHVTHLVRNRHNLVVFALALSALLAVGLVDDGGWLRAGIGAACGVWTLVLMVVMAITPGGSIGGGDLKLLPSVALIIGLHSPVVSTVWLLVSFIATLMVLTALRLRGASKKAGVPMIPIAAISMPISVLILIPAGLAAAI